MGSLYKVYKMRAERGTRVCMLHVWNHEADFDNIHISKIGWVNLSLAVILRVAQLKPNLHEPQIEFVPVL